MWVSQSFANLFIFLMNCFLITTADAVCSNDQKQITSGEVTANV